MINIVSLGTAMRKEGRIYHYMCMICGTAFKTFKRGDYSHQCEMK